MSGNKGPTLREIAEIAGVSTATVSRALRSDLRQSKETRDRIQKIARKVGYQFDPLLSQNMSLIRRREAPSIRGTLAYVNGCLNQRELKNNIQYLHGAQRRAKTYGYKVDHIWYDRKVMTQSRFHKILLARGIKGLLIAPLFELTETLDLPWDQFASVAYGFTLERPPLHVAADDHSEAMQLALKMLRKKGYRRIGFVTEERMEAQSRQLWLSSFHLDLQGRPRIERVPPLLLGMRSINQMKSWYKKYKPEAVICSGVGTRYFRKFHDENKGIPSYINLEVKMKKFPNDTGIRQRAEEVGAIGVDVVMEQILHNQVGIPEDPRVTMTQPIWNEGTSAPALIQK
ncbi:MAG: LacI family DNA-binding transcriptional regulator [Verrucomicrobiota bacterium]